jgi:metal-responsive CopG/Arc/MetJ family transcriptional regulator
MKVAISLPDTVFKAVDQLTHKLKKSRSQLYAEAIAVYVGVRRDKAVTAKLSTVYGGESSEIDPALKDAQLETLCREMW